MYEYVTFLQSRHESVKIIRPTNMGNTTETN